MPTFRVALVALCLAAPVLLAQDPVVDPSAPPPIPVIEMPGREEAEEPAAAPEVPQGDRPLKVLQSGRNRPSAVGAQADVTGNHGDLLLDNATAPASGVLLRAATATPDVFLKLGTQTSASGFTVLSASDAALFKVRGDGYTILRRDQDAATGIEINNANAGTATAEASRQVRFFAGGTQVAKLSSTGSASTGATGGANALQLWNFASGPMIFGTSSAERMRILADGNVSIGATSNHGKLSTYNYSDNGRAMFVYQHAVVDATIRQDDAGLFVNAVNTVPLGVTNTGGLIAGQMDAWNYGPGTVTWATGGYFHAGNYYGFPGTVTTATAVHAAVESGGGTVNTGYGVYIADAEAINDFGIYQNGPDDTNFFSGTIGIGTTTPQQKLHVLGNIAMQNTNPASYTSFILNSGAVGTGGSLTATGATYTNQPNSAHAAGTVALTSLETGGLSLSSGNVTTGNVRMYTGGTGPANERLRVTQTGDIGIGTATPSAKLHVVGNLLTTGNITATGNLTTTGNIIATGNITGAKVIGAVYQDLAEWVPATVDMAAGTVVVLNRDRNNEVMPSSRQYDTTVAGVVSASPGILLGVEGAEKEQIATTGRVKVRVDARVHAVRVGDLLVTSDISGTAMRSEPMQINGREFHQPGTIIGKALEPLQGGVGEILVLLSMQ
ncbi:MAG TPA: hypothetical protein VE974_11045 [Thermoanaerobaculia bacterium]|nr:hypothetical protein [Thermoanaerobaculia bacterium]